MSRQYTRALCYLCVKRTYIAQSTAKVLDIVFKHVFNGITDTRKLTHLLMSTLCRGSPVFCSVHQLSVWFPWVPPVPSFLPLHPAMTVKCPRSQRVLDRLRQSTRNLSTYTGLASWFNDELDFFLDPYDKIFLPQIVRLSLFRSSSLKLKY